MMITKERITSLSRQYLPEIIASRRHLHQHPELSFEEYQTSAYIEEQLIKEGIGYRKGYVKTGIVGMIEGINPGSRVVALRADMDALPVTEQNQTDYRSQSEGKMHACGHDVHMACLLGAAKILNHLRQDMKGKVLLIFQPAEERLPGGARQLIEEGALKDPKPDVVIGQHVQPGMLCGQVGFRPGIYMASSDEIFITVKGTGGHAAMPNQLVDTVLIASHIVVGLQQIVSRQANPAQPTVLSFGVMEAKGAVNVIPDTVRLEGTFRTMDEAWREEAHKKINQLAQGIAGSMGGQCEVLIKKGYPVLINHPEITARAMEFSGQLLGKDKVNDLDIRMTAEDFAYYSQHFPSVFYRLGVSDPNGAYAAPLHSPHFDVDENALLTGMMNMAWLAVSFLHQP
jgi:amidohydrolase